MFNSPKHVLAFKKKLDYVSTCPNSPLHGMAFCKEHCEVMKEMGIPTQLKAYLEYKKTHSTIVGANHLTSALDCQGK